MGIPSIKRSQLSVLEQTQQYYGHTFYLSSVLVYVPLCVIKVLTVDIRNRIAVDVRKAIRRKTFESH